MTKVVTEDAGALAMWEVLQMVPVVVCVSIIGGLDINGYGVAVYVAVAVAAATAHPDPKDKNCFGERGWKPIFSTHGGVHPLL